MNQPEVLAFARRWADAWNAHDVDAVLAHFADDVTFTSPYAAQVVADSDGVIRGKAALREYWQAGLALLPDLHFEIEGVFLGVDCVVIDYRNERGGLVNEVLIFDGDLVTAGHATYLVADEA